MLPLPQLASWRGLRCWGRCRGAAAALSAGARVVGSAQAGVFGSKWPPAPAAVQLQHSLQTPGTKSAQPGRLLSLTSYWSPQVRCSLQAWGLGSAQASGISYWPLQGGQLQHSLQARESGSAQA